MSKNMGYGIRPFPGVCCPDASCVHEKNPVVCKECGKNCVDCLVWAQVRVAELEKQEEDLSNRFKEVSFALCKSQDKNKELEAQLEEEREANAVHVKEIIAESFERLSKWSEEKARADKLEARFDKCAEFDEEREQRIKELENRAILVQLADGKITLRKASEELKLTDSEVINELISENLYLRYLEIPVNTQIADKCILEKQLKEREMRIERLEAELGDVQTRWVEFNKEGSDKYKFLLSEKIATIEKLRKEIKELEGVVSRLQARITAALDALKRLNYHPEALDEFNISWIETAEQALSEEARE